MAGRCQALLDTLVPASMQERQGRKGAGHVWHHYYSLANILGNQSLRRGEILLEVVGSDRTWPALWRVMGGSHQGQGYWGGK